MNKVIFKDDMMCISSTHDNRLYHEVEIKSEINGELDSITIDKSTGKIVVRFKSDTREKMYDVDGNYVKPLDKDRNAKLIIREI